MVANHFEVNDPVLNNKRTFLYPLVVFMALFLRETSAFPNLDSLKGDLLYNNALDQVMATKEWVLEGPAKVEFRDDWMEMYSPGKEGHHVYWCPEEFPTSFIAEWEMQNLDTDAGLCIIFFAARGTAGENIFDPGLRTRNGIFSGYTKSDINCYHISYYANTPNAPDRPFSHLRKNTGFHKVHIGKAPLRSKSIAVHKVTLIKDANHIIMYLDDRKIIDWRDDGRTYGPVLGSGKMGFRQMRWTHFRYRNFKVWNLAGKEKTENGNIWPRHVIDNSSQGADGVKLGDIDRDGRQDIVTGWEEGGITKLYINPGPDKVKEKWPSVVVGETKQVEDAVFMDMDADGQFEIVSCTENKSKKIFVHRVMGRDFLNSSNWKQEILPASEDIMMWMYAEPIQLDGLHSQDLIAAGKGENASIGWFEAPQQPWQLKDWKWHEISSVGWIMSIMLRDMDNDGDLDIVITDRRGDQRGCRWLENPGLRDSQKKQWTSHLIGAMDLEVMFMTMSDLDQNGTEEVIVSERTNQTIRIFEKLSPMDTVWKETIIQLPDTIGTAKSVEVGDLNSDSVLDFVISTNTNGKNTDGLFWLNGASGKVGEGQIFLTISGAHNAKYDKVELIDLDEDGDLDVLICEENFGDDSQGLGVIWYENRIGGE